MEAVTETFSMLMRALTRKEVMEGVHEDPDEDPDEDAANKPSASVADGIRLSGGVGRDLDAHGGDSVVVGLRVRVRTPCAPRELV